MIYLDNYQIFEEKSIGSEEIRNKWYSDIPKDLFYKAVNIDPTSVRKKDFSKPGKYVKWILNCIKKIINDSSYDNIRNHNPDYLDYFLDERLNFCLFIFSTGWFKSINTTKFYLSGEMTTTYNNPNDIFKYKSISNFVSKIGKLKDRYKSETEEAKYDVVYSDENVKILVPLNFTGSFETAKNTQWCSQSYYGYSMWNQAAILYRILPKIDGYDKLKLTWVRQDGRWYLACSKYPEITGSKSPFDLVNGIENWKSKLDENINAYNNRPDIVDLLKQIDKTMSLLTKESKDFIVNYYNNKK